MKKNSKTAAKNGKTVKVYTADVSPLCDASLYERVYYSVNNRRREKTDRLRRTEDKRLSLGAEYLLMCACRDSGTDYNKLTVASEPNSKPSFENCDLSFNLSHSGERVMCVMSSLPVGCDVEKISSADIRIAERFFSEREKAYLHTVADENEKKKLFIKIWTLKESFVKCTGKGFSTPFESFSVTDERGNISLLQSEDNCRYELYGWDSGDGYRYAVCAGNCEKGEINFDIINVTIE